MKLLPTDGERHLRAYLAALNPDIAFYSIPRSALQEVVDELDRLRGQLAQLSDFVLTGAVDQPPAPGTVAMAEVDRLRARLAEASLALRAVGKAAIVVHPVLAKPYADAPDTTPWDRFMRAPASRAYNLGWELHRELKGRHKAGKENGAPSDRQR